MAQPSKLPWPRGSRARPARVAKPPPPPAGRRGASPFHAPASSVPGTPVTVERIGHRALVDHGTQQMPFAPAISESAPRRRRRLPLLLAGAAVLAVAVVGVVVLLTREQGAATPRSSPSTSAATTTVPFAPERGLWAGWPKSDKPPIGLGDTGEAVRYLQGVLRLKASQRTLAVDGRYGSATQNAVRLLQRFVHLPPTGRVDAATWAMIDRLASG